MAIIRLDPGTDATGDLSLWQVTSVVSGTIATDATVSHNGPRSMKSNVTVATGEGYVRNASGDGVAAAAGRRFSMWGRVSTVTPSQASTLFRLFGSSEMMRVELDTNGKLKFTANAVVKSSTTVLTANTFYRISYSYKTTTVSNWSAKVWINGNLEISASNADGNLTAADADLFMLGLFNSAVMSAWFDDIYIDDGTGVDDPGNVYVTAKRPFSNGTANQFITQIGVGGSGYGTGHAPQVNEIPVSATNGWSLSNTARQTEEYTVEGQSVGDADMTGSTILGYTGWIRALVNSTANSPVHRIMVGGTLTAKTMTTSAATYQQAGPSAAFPSGGTDIGMDAQYTTTPHLTSLLECGLIFAYIPSTTGPLTPDYRPNPIIVRRPNVGFEQGIDLTLLGKDKFFGLAGHPNYDWPNPIIAGRSIDLGTFTNPMEAQLIGKDQFFGAPGERTLTDFPNPIPPRYPMENKGFVNPVEVNLLGKDQFFGAPGQPPANLDWPNPLIARRPIDNLTWLLNLQQGTLFVVVLPFALSDWPNPLPPRYGIDLRTFLNQTNIRLIGQDQFFGAPGQGPANLDWPNPIIRPYRNELRTHLDAIRLNLLGKDQFFGAPGQAPANTDWPNPLPPRWASDLRIFLNPLSLNLYGQDQMFGAPGQVPNYDWTNPLIAGRSIELRTIALNLFNTLLNYIPPPPFYMLDWPNPLIKPLGITLRTHAEQLKLNLLGQDRFFGAPGMGPSYDYPNPLIARRAIDLNTIALGLTTGTLYVLYPFVQDDWPNPIIRPSRNDLRVFNEAMKLNLLGQDQFFGDPGQAPANLDWPLPGRYPFPVGGRTHTQTGVRYLGLDKFFGAAGMGPHYDYPNPLIKPHAIVLKTHLDPTRIKLIGKDQFFGAPGERNLTDFPNPIIKGRSIDLRTIAVNLLQSTFGPPVHVFYIARIDGELYAVTGITDDAFVLTGLNADAFVVGGVDGDTATSTGVDGDDATATGIDDDSDMESN